MIPKITVIGNSVLNNPIPVWTFESKKSKRDILILAGVHGDEIEGVDLARSTIRHLYSKESELNSTVHVLPILNVDGFFLNLRSNFNDVDLNRNIPTQNWNPEIKNHRYKPGLQAGSEPETVAFMRFLSDVSPALIVSLHSFDKSLLLINSGVFEFRSLVNELSLNLQIPIVEKMDYEVTGSLNTLGKEKGISCLTVEAPRGSKWNDIQFKFTEQFLHFADAVFQHNL